jgi:hypothetical protein
MRDVPQTTNFNLIIMKETENGFEEKVGGFVRILLIFIGVMILLSMCERSSCSGGDYDDRWDRLQHEVDTDPYYQQWK